MCRSNRRIDFNRTDYSIDYLHNIKCIDFKLISQEITNFESYSPWPRRVVVVSSSMKRVLQNSLQKSSLSSNLLRKQQYCSVINDTKRSIPWTSAVMIIPVSQSESMTILQDLVTELKSYGIPSVVLLVGVIWTARMIGKLEANITSYKEISSVKYSANKEAAEAKISANKEAAEAKFAATEAKAAASKEAAEARFASAEAIIAANKYVISEISKNAAIVAEIAALKIELAMLKKN